jgi:maltose/moltooligosaccharide transporter
VFFIHNQFLLILPFCLIGIAYLTMQTQAFSIFTTSLDGSNEGAYMGLFNCGICLPQIIASVASFAIFPLVGKSMPHMILVAGIAMVMGIVAVSVITDNTARRPIRLRIRAPLQPSAASTQNAPRTDESSTS